ncbi:MAG: response regulator [Bacteroidales bacterium]|jgi:CheY-like chemotaxis protein|nr:response regulator [Bacteroidales bacterium]
MDFIRILVVDYIYTNRLLLAELIKLTGNEVVLVENGEQAINALKEEEFHLVFMDIEMPVMNGIETTKHIRGEMSFPINAIPIVALTAQNPEIFFEDYSDVGFDDLITKPYSIDKIKEKIEEVLNT